MTEGPYVPQPSNEKLKTDVANFMARADEIVQHPLSTADPTFKLLFSFDPETTLLTSINIDLDAIDKSSWVYLAVLMRPIVFNEKDPISFAKLTVAIGAEHDHLRGILKQGRVEFLQWQKHMYIGQQLMGPVSEEHRGLETGTVVKLDIGEVGTVPDGVDLDQMVPDYTLAKTYLNGMLWHSDTEKAAEFQAASAHGQAFYAKCAEIRTITAIRYVRDLRQFIINTRELGLDF